MNLKVIAKFLVILILLGLNTSIIYSIQSYQQRTEEIKIQILDEEQAIKVAFFGDGSVPSHNKYGRSVFELIKRENAELVVMSGDMINREFEGAAEEWNAMVNQILGENFPLISAIGNHDVKYWHTFPPLLNARIAKAAPHLKCEGELSVNMTCIYKDRIQVVLSGIGTRGSEHVAYAMNSLAARNDINWKACAFHKVQRLMQVGGKVDEVGWNIYEECRKAGAIIATGHEHSYARTHLMSNFASQTIASNASTMVIEKGKSIAFVAGTGGHELRDYESGLERNPWWAKTYSEDDENATFGALFCNFKTNTADCYFKNIRNEIIDSFTLHSKIATPIPTPIPNTIPRCEEFNVYKDDNTLLTGSAGNINISTESTTKFKIVTSAVDNEESLIGKKVDICWSIAGQPETFYQRGLETITCESVLSKPSTSTNAGRAETISKTFQEYVNALLIDSNNKMSIKIASDVKTLISSEIGSKGLVFFANYYDSSNLYCSSNVGWNGGKGAVIEIGNFNNRNSDPNNCAVIKNTNRTCIAAVKLQTNSVLTTTPSPTPNITPTISVTPSITLSPTPTSIPTPNINISPVPTVSVTPTITLSPTPTTIPSPIPNIDITYVIADINRDGEITIIDFALFIEYYKTENCLIDFDKDLNCRDIDDFKIFKSYYLDGQ